MDQKLPTIQIDKSVCIRCGACVSACPMRVLRLEPEGTAVRYPQRCIDCRHCTAACPTKAIQFGDGAEDYPEPSEDALLRLVQTRRSVRSYQDRMPNRALVRWALNGAAWAPSGKNIHENGWSVLWGREAVEKAYRMTLDWSGRTGIYPELLRNDQRGMDLVTCGAPCVILGHSHPETLNPLLDTGIAMATVELLLVEHGLATCWGGYLRHAVNDDPALKAYCGIDPAREVYGILMVGYAKEHYCNVPYRPEAKAVWVEQGK